MSARISNLSWRDRSGVPAILVCCAVGFFAHPSASLAESATELRQESSLGGALKVYLSSTALKVVNERTRISVFSKGPKWIVRAYSDKNHTYLETTPEKFNGLTAGNLYKLLGFELANVSDWKKTGSLQIANVAADEYKAKRTSRVDNGARNQFQPRVASLLVMHKDIIPPRACLILCKLDGLPAFPHVPLQLKYSEGFDDHTPLKTLSSKELSASSTTFAEPKNYKRVKDEMQIDVESPSIDGIEDFLGPGKK